MRKTLFAALAILLIGACSKKDSTPATPAPTVSFTYTKSSNSAPSNVQFTSTATNTTSYAWDFGDGSSSTTANPSHTYSSNGTFNVTLSVTGAGGSATTSSQVVLTAVVITPPTASFNYSGNGAAPSTVSFTNTSTNATSYSWDFGDNNNNTSNLQNPTHSYLVGGTYTVTLTATNAGGSNSTTKTVNVAAAYTKCVITSVTISAFPATTSTGGGWDGTSAPDLFFNITDSVNTIKYNNSANVKTDVLQSQLPVTWTLSPTYNVAGSSIYSYRYIDLWDYDTPDPNDYINYAGFRLSDYISLPNPYPSSITFTQNGITATLQLTWQP